MDRSSTQVAIAPPAPAGASKLQDASVWFQRNFRFAADSGIGRLAAAINAGRADDAAAVLGAAAEHELHWIADDAPQKPWVAA
mgnify:CR=1 FL=1